MQIQVCRRLSHCRSRSEHRQNLVPTIVAQATAPHSTPLKARVRVDSQPADNIWGRIQDWSRPQYLEVLPEVAQIAPNTGFGLDLIPPFNRGTLDIISLSDAGNELSLVWRSIQKRHEDEIPGRSELLQAVSLMREIAVRYKPADASGAPVEFYIVANMCFKHAWNASGDEDERAWTTAHILQTMAITANILASKANEQQQADESLCWAQRCIDATQLCVQIYNTPGLHQEAKLPPAPQNVPSMGILDHLAMRDHQKIMALQLTALASAEEACATCSILDHQASFRNLTLHLTLHLGPWPSGALEFVEMYATLILSGALVRYPKPAGYSVNIAKAFLICTQGHGPWDEARERVSSELQAHELWCNNLKPIMKRAQEVYEHSEDSREEWSAVYDEVKVMMTLLRQQDWAQIRGILKICLSTTPLRVADHNRSSAVLEFFSLPEMPLPSKWALELLVLWAINQGLCPLPHGTIIDANSEVVYEAKVLLQHVVAMAMASWDFTTLEYVMGFLGGESVHPDLQAMRSAQAVSSVLAHNLSSHLDILEGMLQKGHIIGLEANRIVLRGLELTRKSEAVFACQLVDKYSPSNQQLNQELFTALCEAGQSRIAFDSWKRLQNGFSEGWEPICEPNAAAHLIETALFDEPEEADLACQLVDTILPGNHVQHRSLQHMLLSKLCTVAPLPMALNELQKRHEYIGNKSRVYAQLMRRLVCVEDITGLLTTATKANDAYTIVLSGLAIACWDPAVGHAQLRSQAAWCIYTAACGSGQVLNSQAQSTLWKLQTGDNLLELYKQWKSQAGYAWKRPSPDSLAAVAGLLIERQQGKDAIVVASEVAVGDAHAGAHVVQACINGAQQDEDLCDVLAQVFQVLSKQYTTSTSPAMLSMALKAFVQLSDPDAALTSLKEHQQLAQKWTNLEQHQVFQAALGLFVIEPSHSALQFVTAVCKPGFVRQSPAAVAQHSQLVHACLSAGKLMEARKIAKWAAKFCGEVQMQTAVAVLKAAVIADETSWATAQMLDLVRQLAPTSWEKLLDKQTAHLLIDHFMAERKWQLVLRIYQQQAANSQAIDEDMWSQACKALQQTRDQLGGYHAWLWARDHYPTWLHKDPSCYLFLVLAIASNHDQPVEGARLLLSYPQQSFATQLPLKTCNMFLQRCIAPSDSHRSTADCQEAVVALVKGMLSPEMPASNQRTFILAADSMFAGTTVDVQAHQVLMLLHQDVLPVLHAALGSEQDTYLVYEHVLTRFAADSKAGRPGHMAQIVQVVLLMAQYGLSGLSESCCQLFVESFNLDPYMEAWAGNTFGDDFFATVEAVAYGAAIAPRGKSGVPFPSNHLPTLAVSSVGAESYLILQDDETPVWMIPPELQWQHYDNFQDRHASRPVSADTNSLREGDGAGAESEHAAAEELERTYGHLLNTKKQKK